MSRLFHATVAVIVLSASLVRAQDDSVPLGDLARAVRKSKPAAGPEVIDNDNFGLMMDKAESARLNGEPVFAVVKEGNSFTAVSPDGTCSLSFDARTIARMQVPSIAADLPAEELLKLDGPAAMENGLLQASLHNGTRWLLKEITVGIVPLDARKDSAVNPAESDGPPPETGPEAPRRLPERSIIYHLKGSGLPDSTTVFQALLDPASTPPSEWRWTIVAARGIPPRPETPVETQLAVSPPAAETGAPSEPPPAPSPQGPSLDGGSPPPAAVPTPQP